MLLLIITNQTHKCPYQQQSHFSRRQSLSYPKSIWDKLGISISLIEEDHLNSYCYSYHSFT